MNQSGTRRNFTDADLHHIAALRGQVPVVEIARQLGRDRTTIYHGMAQLDRLGEPARRHYARWTVDDDDDIRDLYGVWSNVALARRLGRTVGALAQRAWELGVSLRDNYWQPDQVGALLGVTDVTVHKWIRTGELHAMRTPRRYAIQGEEIERFIVRYPWRYDWRRVERGHFRQLAERTWRADPLLTLAEVAERLGCSVTPIRRAIRRGRLPAYQGWKWRGSAPWLVKTSDLAAFCQASGREVEI